MQTDGIFNFATNVKESFFLLMILVNHAHVLQIRRFTLGEKEERHLLINVSTIAHQLILLR